LQSDNVGQKLQYNSGIRFYDEYDRSAKHKSLNFVQSLQNSAKYVSIIAERS